MEKYKYIAQILSWLFVFTIVVSFSNKTWPERVPAAFSDAAAFILICAMLVLWIDSIFDIVAWIWGLFK